MMKRYLNWAFAAVICSLTACVDKDVPDPTTPVTSGTANFSRYIAVGNSLAAGYTNGGLYQAGQVVAYPNLLAGQFALAGGGSFTSPLFPASQPNGTGYLKLSGTNSDGTPNITQVAPQSVRSGTTLAGTPLYTKYTGALNNYGVPGIKVANIFDATYGNFNGFYERLLAGNAGTNTTPYLTFVTASPFTFFTSELGSNDALDYATSDGMTASRMLTEQALFGINYQAALLNLTTGGRKGVVATIPDITVLPFFHYITIATLRAAAGKNTGQGSDSFADLPVFIQALNANGTYSVRQATAADDIMLTLDLSKVASGGSLFYAFSASSPIPSSLVLDAREIANVQTAITGYNNSIRFAANAYNVPVLDAYALFNQLQSGVMENGVTINTNFLTGGVFSLDGIHLTPRGNAVVTNEFIKVINATYGSTLPALDISKYGGAGSN